MQKLKEVCYSMKNHFTFFAFPAFFTSLTASAESQLCFAFDDGDGPSIFALLTCYLEMGKTIYYVKHQIELKHTCTAEEDKMGCIGKKQ